MFTTSASSFFQTLLILFAFTCFIHCYKLPQQSFLIPQSVLNYMEATFAVERESSATKNTQTLKDFTILKKLPRKGKLSFTEGLTFTDANTLLESSGMYGESFIQYVDLNDMSTIKEQSLEDSLFGEGCDLIKNDDDESIYQLTYRERKVLLWDPETFTLKKTLKMPKEIREGWGMAKRIEGDKDGGKTLDIYITDGSNQIFVVDPKTFQIKDTLNIMTSNDEKVNNLNELEFVKGKLWANIWGEDKIAVIDPDTSRVEAFVDLSPLVKTVKEEATKSGLPWDLDSVLNGIAYHAETDQLVVTGKMWPMMWLIKVEGL